MGIFSTLFGGRGSSQGGSYSQVTVPSGLSGLPPYGIHSPGVADAGEAPATDATHRILNASTATLPTGWSEARSTTATYYNSSGVVSTASANTLRNDYTSAGSLRGYLLEGAATNLLNWSQSITTANQPPWFQTAGCATVTATNVADPAGGTTASTINFVAGGGTGGTGGAVYEQQMPVSLNTVYTLSAWMKSSVTGGASFVRFSTNNSVAWNTGMGQKFTLTSTWTRYTMTGIVSTSNGGPGNVANIGFDSREPVGGTWDNTIAGNVDVWGIQLELGTQATSYIPTTSANVSRGADVASFTLDAAATDLALTYDDGSVTIYTGVPPGSTFNVPTSSSLDLLYVDDNVAAAGSVGAATGAGTATAEGASTAASQGASSGSATVAAVGASTAASTGSTTGTGAASGIGKSTAASVGNAAGSATVTAVGASTARSVGAAAGSGAATAVGAATAASVGFSAGSGSATAIGASTAASGGSSAGSGTATAVGTASESGIGDSTGSGAATATGIAITVGVGSSTGSGAAAAYTGTIAQAAGSGTASGSGNSIVAGIGASAGIGAATSIGVGVQSTIGSSAGSGTASGVGTTVGATTLVSAAGTAVGSGAAAGIAQAAIVSAIGIAAGSSIPIGFAPSVDFSNDFDDDFATLLITLPQQNDFGLDFNLDFAILRAEDFNDDFGDDFAVSHIARELLEDFNEDFSDDFAVFHISKHVTEDFNDDFSNDFAVHHGVQRIVSGVGRAGGASIVSGPILGIIPGTVPTDGEPPLEPPVYPPPPPPVPLVWHPANEYRRVQAPRAVRIHRRGTELRKAIPRSMKRRYG